LVFLFFFFFFFLIFTSKNICLCLFPLLLTQCLSRPQLERGLCIYQAFRNQKASNFITVPKEYSSEAGIHFWNKWNSFLKWMKFVFEMNEILWNTCAVFHSQKLELDWELDINCGDPVQNKLIFIEKIITVYKTVYSDMAHLTGTYIRVVRTRDF
jgi:hypothetical protein